MDPPMDPPMDHDPAGGSIKKPLVRASISPLDACCDCAGTGLMVSSRLRLSDDLVNQVLRGLTDRDRLICRLVWEHSVLTTDQIAEVCFGTLTRAQLRLVRLHRLRLLDRFRPYRSAGSAPFHYVLGSAGAAVLAAERGVEVAELGYQPQAALRWTMNQRLGHLVGVNAFFTSLMGTARRSGGNALLAEWWSERRCARAMGGLVRPDGYGVWREGTAMVEFCLEHDRGTERGPRLADKLGGYADLEAATGIRRWVLFWFPSTRRESEARRTLAATLVPVATAACGMGRPADAIWLPLGGEGPRLRLGGLS
jgi:hypothetical protein